MRALVLCLSLLSLSAHAQILLAPPPFTLKSSGAQAVYPDFVDATYNITFDIAKRETRIQSTIHFLAPQAGMPVFDLKAEPASLSLDGEAVTQESVSPASDAMPVRVIQKQVSAGAHTLVVTHLLEGEYGPSYGNGSVNSGFFMDDIAGDLLQPYLPSSFEYDQVAMTFNIEILGLTQEQLFFTNGKVTQKDAAHWTIQFPSYFNCSAVYFHTVAKNEVSVVSFQAPDGKGGFMPAQVYKKNNSGLNLEAFKTRTLQSLDNLEGRFGPFPHESVTIYAANGGGGMEYSGATVSEMRAVKHELAHSYFGRGVMPANGNANWIDEAMASYSDAPSSANPNDISTTNMAAHSAYYTRNDSNGYDQGLNLLAHFGGEFQAGGKANSMDGFMKSLAQAEMHEPITTEILKTSMETYSGLNLTQEFWRYVYGYSGNGIFEIAQTARAYPPMHMRLTAELRRELQ